MNSCLPEILVANGIGAALVILLYLSRIKTHETKTIGEQLFDIMLIITLSANIAEIISFLIDGKDFAFCHALQLAVNAFCIGSTVIIGYLWCLYTVFRAYRSNRHIKKAYVMLGLPFAAVMILLLADLFGAGLIFTISPENVYSREFLAPLVYLALFFYYAYSIMVVFRCRKRGLHVQFFPVLYFVVPCVVGTVIQGLFYGITVGWLMVSVAFVFVQLNLQNENTFIDGLSGLYNRKYLGYLFNRLEHGHYENVYGIMMDVNEFKKINDTCGHVAGDDTIRYIGALLLESIPTGSMALRIGGDEFIVLLTDSSPEKAEEMRQRILGHVNDFNQKGDKPYTLSVSTGSAHYTGGDTEAFLADMDRQLYQCKERYYLVQTGCSCV